MSKLSRPLRTMLRDTTPGPAEVERLYGALGARRSPRRTAWLAAPTLLAAAAALLLVIRRPPPVVPADQPLLLAGGQPVAVLDADAPREVRFEDGSLVALSAGASLHPVSSDGRDVDLLLRRGQGRFEIAGAGRRWTIDAGIVQVQTGEARFAVWRSDAGVDVAVYSGEVVLRGERVPGRVHKLSAKGTLHVPAASADASAPASPGPRGSEPPAAAAPTRLVQEGQHRREDRTATVRERRTATEGPAGNQAAALTPPPAPGLAELLGRADAARLSGRPAEAAQLLDRVSREFAADRRAAIAAFTRGRICADELRDPIAAAGAFAQAIRLGLPDALGETAYLRLVETRLAAGDRAGAAAARREYIEHYPSGALGPKLDRLLSAP